MASIHRGTVLRRLARLMVLVQALRYRPSYVELGRELGVCPRTARRYLYALEESGLPLPAGWTQDGRKAAA